MLGEVLPFDLVSFAPRAHVYVEIPRKNFFEDRFKLPKKMFSEKPVPKICASKARDNGSSSPSTVPNYIKNIQSCNASGLNQTRNSRSINWALGVATLNKISKILIN